jgi:hypothetical protein
MKLMDVTFPAPGAGQYTLWARIANVGGKVRAENNYEFTVK